MAIVLALALCLVSFAGTPESISPGSKAPTFTLKDADGAEHSLNEFLKSKFAVVMFIATQCPVSNAYNERIVALNNEYASKGVTFIGINSNRQESAAEVKEHSAKHGFKFAVLKDPGNTVADAYGAQVTPEIFVIDSQGMVRYHGRIDDSQDTEDIKSRDLSIALDALIAGKEAPRAVTKAFGCSIKRMKK
jgi:peroxiredoxin